MSNLQDDCSGRLIVKARSSVRDNKQRSGGLIPATSHRDNATVGYLFTERWFIFRWQGLIDRSALLLQVPPPPSSRFRVPHDAQMPPTIGSRAHCFFQCSTTSRIGRRSMQTCWDLVRTISTPLWRLSARCARLRWRMAPHLIPPWSRARRSARSRAMAACGSTCRRIGWCAHRAAGGHWFW